jgi:hypothetical protein
MYAQNKFSAMGGVPRILFNIADTPLFSAMGRTA